MDLRSLKYFVTVFEQGSISAAARYCFISQPSVSAALAELEKELGAELFIRHQKGVSPTQAGQELYHHALPLLGQAKALTKLFQKKAQPVSFRLGLIPALGSRRMSHLLKAIRDQVENLSVTLVEPSELCDARIILREQLHDGEIFERLWQDKYMVAIPGDHPLRLTDSLSLEDLKGQNFIYREPSVTLQKLYRRLEEEEIHLNIQAKIRTIEYAVSLVEAGLGIAFVPNLTTIQNRTNILLKPLKDLNLIREIGIGFFQAQEIHPALQALIDLTRRTHKGP